MKKLLLFSCVTLLLIGCSNDNDSNLLIENSPGENTSLENNGFLYNGNFLSTPVVYVHDENTDTNESSDIAIIMSNYNLLTENASSGVNFVYLDFQDVEIRETTYTDILDYTILENATVNQQIVDGGTLLLSDTDEQFSASNISLTVNSISANSINFNFTVTRADGMEISGNYSGEYQNIYNSTED